MKKPLKITFEAYEQDGRKYVFIDKDDWDIKEVSMKHFLLVEVEKLPSLEQEPKD